MRVFWCALGFACATARMASAQVVVPSPVAPVTAPRVIVPTAPSIPVNSLPPGTPVSTVPGAIPGIPATAVPVDALPPGTPVTAVPSGVPVFDTPVVSSLPPPVLSFNPPISAPVVLPPSVTGTPGPTLFLGFSGPPGTLSVRNGDVINTPMGTALTPTAVQREILTTAPDPFAPSATGLTPAPVVILPPSDPHARPAPIAGVSLPPSASPSVIVVESPSAALIRAGREQAPSREDDGPSLTPGAPPLVRPLSSNFDVE